ncbi:Arm DNA-binding domain-containing protein [Micromonospora sp. KC606]|uniref:Arm DNA-binding domain-containing protein n=1 Tax=Micromonospora sp. KC606 TaxID=2530379 RepID=UPI001FB7E9C2|nr:Arm DNA-binding domain-containing protein [Micromonospora sp. KC606]
MTTGVQHVGQLRTKRKSCEFAIDLPRGRDGKRRQMRRRGFKTEKLAEREARTRFGNVDLAEDGTVAAELVEWLQEREPDVAVTTLADYRNAVMKYIIRTLS